MNNYDYNSGEFKTSDENENRYVTSSFIDNKRHTSIVIIVSIFLLLIISCVFFAVFTDESIPVWNPEPSVSTTTTTKKPPIPQNPDAEYPYATVTNKTQFVANDGGEWAYNLYSGYAILIKLSDMSTIAHKYADEIIYPASMTKVMTIVTAVDLIENLEDIYVFEPEALAGMDSESSTADMMYLYNNYGSTNYTVLDLLYGISYRSGADSVICLLDYLGLSMSEFASLMNAKADEIGLKNTHFGGAIGMDSENNTTTCRDMAAIMAYAMENPLCKEVLGGVSYRLKYIEMTYYNSTLHKTLTNMGTNTSRVLWGDYTIVATKSGLEDKAGYCLVSCIENNDTGELFVLVTANAKKSESYPSNQNPILDMREIFENFAP